jgi:hypothetical protein
MSYLVPATSNCESGKSAPRSLNETVPASARPCLSPANSYASLVDFNNRDVTGATTWIEIAGPTRCHGSTPPLSNFLHHKVLRLSHTGFGDATRREHISGGPFSQGSLSVRGEALIHGPSLVARPVGSEWRTRRPHQEDIKFNQTMGDQV